MLGQASLAPEQREMLTNMARVMVHRGPDGEGFYFDGRVGLAHRRLSIIDLESGKQPLSNENGRVWVVFNGEVYNYIELRKRLLQKGHQFRTASDTEVIVHLYEEEGEEFLKSLRGMFAIALWDNSKEKLILARDRIGKKPLYYAQAGALFVFASEIKSLLQVSGLQRDIDPESLSDYFSLLYVPAPKSIFKQVRKVQPAHYVVIDRAGAREKPYWDLSFDDVEELSEQAWCERLLQEYYESVRLRLRSDVPLGAFLSGGVDSSSVVAVMHKISNHPISTCSVGFDEKRFDESHHAAVFAASLGTEHHEERIRPDAMAVLKKLAWHYDEPFADSSAVPTYYVSQAARRHVTVALSGDGGDENFAGYRRYRHDCVENRVRAVLPERFRECLFGGLGSWYPKLDWAPRVVRAQATFRALSQSAVAGYFYSVSGIKPELKRMLLNGDVWSSLNGYRPVTLFEDLYRRPRTADHLSRLQYVDMKTYLVDDILVKVDRASMANSLEVRCPLLDHKLMESVARIPSRLKLRGRQGKYIFKRALKNLLPEEILTRRKQGFVVPLARWFRGELREISGDIILNHDRLGVLDPTAVRLLWEGHQSGRSDFSSALWAILMFRLWEETYLQEGQRAKGKEQRANR